MEMSANGFNLVGGNPFYIRQASGANQLTITTGGNVGIGTSSPAGKLEVSADQSANNQHINITGTQTSYNQSYSIGIPTSTKDLRFYDLTAGTERMRIRSNGSIGIGTVGQDSVKLEVKGGGTGSTNYAVLFTDSSANDLLFVRTDGVINTGTRAGSPYNNTSANVANLYVSAGGTLERATASSQRFKENIKDWDGNGLSTILALKPKTFTYKKEYYKNPELQMLGLIAEEVAEVSPFLAEYQNEDRSGQVENVRYATIVVPLIKAIQEQQAQIEELKALILNK
jgi:hypothetical protein